MKKLLNSLILVSALLAIVSCGANDEYRLSDVVPDPISAEDLQIKFLVDFTIAAGSNYTRLGTANQHECGVFTGRESITDRRIREKSEYTIVRTVVLGQNYFLTLNNAGTVRATNFSIRCDSSNDKDVFDALTASAFVSVAIIPDL